MAITPEPLTREAFMPFGDVIEVSGNTAELINQGNTQKYSNLAKLVADGEGRISVAIYRSKPVQLPFELRMLERHPLGSQAFFPLHNRPFPIIVALPCATPGPTDLRVFLSNGKQGINLHPGIWHHYQLSLEQESDYLVIDRSGAGNYEEFSLENPVILKF